MIWRIILFLVLFIALAIHMWLFAFGLLVYVLCYRGPEALLPALCFDVVFGGQLVLPVATLTTALLIELLDLGVSEVVFYTKT